MDHLFKVSTIRATQNPQQLVWMAMHQDYAEDMVTEDQELAKVPPTEIQAGEVVVRRLLNGNRGHYGCLEHPQITLNVGYFPHSFMQQLRAHRIGVSFDVQSFRYTSKRIVEVALGKREVDTVFYVRPEGTYTDRKGKKYEYTEEDREVDLGICQESAEIYQHQLEVLGRSEEHCRSLLPFDIRQHFVVSMNVRSLMHLLDLRWKADAQLEAQWFCDLLWEEFAEWTPQIAEWYGKQRAKKALLAP